MPPVVAAVASQLLAAVASITVEEFRAQDRTFDSDSRRGRELLHLMADGEWLVETAELVDVRLAHAVVTTLRLTVDLGRVRHEAFDGSTGGVPLPLLTLPLIDAPGGEGGVPAEAALSLTVTDQDGATVAAMAPGEVRRIVSAALAEIVLKIAARRWPGPDPRPVGRRAERLVLSAALHRMLRDRWRVAQPAPAREALPAGEPAPNAPDGPPGARPPAADLEPHHGPGRLRVAQAEVRRVLAGFVEQYPTGVFGGDGAGAVGGDGAGAAGSARDSKGPTARDLRLLVERAAGIVDALANSLCLVLVVPLDQGRPGGPRTFTVQLPARRLVRRGDATLRRPRARLEVDLLFPSADADRRFTLTLPDGVAWEAAPGTGARRRPAGRDAGPAAAHVHVDVDRPRSMGHLDELVGQLLDPGGPAPVARCLADLATSRVDAVRQTLSHHRAPDGDLPDRLRALRAALVAGEGVAAAWAAVDLPATLRRDTTLSAVSPGVVEARTERIDDRAHHGRPHRARAVVDVGVTDSELLSSARFTGAMNLVLMVAVLLFLLHPGARGNVEVVAAALTLFAAIQAGRVVHPDGSTFRGMLAATGYWLVIPSMLPPVILAVALAFVYRDDAPGTRSTAAACAAAAIAGQVAFQAALHRGPLAARRAPGRPPRLVLATPPLVDHARAEVLHCPWWRGTVAEALPLGRDAHAFLVRDRGDRPGAELDAWVAPSGDGTPDRPANVLAVLRSATPRQALSFVVFREPPPAAWAAAHDTRPVDLATDRLAPREAPVELLDVFVGIPRAAPAPTVSGHPLTQVLRIAADLSLRAVDVQLPAPPGGTSRAADLPPALGGPGGGPSWLRVRVGVDEGQLRHCRGFLQALYDATAAGGWDAVLQVVPEIEARTTFSAARPLPAGELVPLPASELDVLDADGPDAAVPLWSVVALCGHARSGLEAELLETLGAHHPGLRLGGMTSAVLHGTSVSLLLLRRPPHGEPPDVAKLVAEFAADDVTAPLAEPQSAWGHLPARQGPGDELDTPPGLGQGPFLRVHLRSRARPGPVACLLDAVRTALLGALGGAGVVGIHLVRALGHG